MTICWDNIWKWHAPNFKDGLAHIPLGPNDAFPLRPGPGFGDGSHPTTRLMLSLMAPRVKNKVVVDIGSGTGILSIASALLGAKKVYAFECEGEAIAHSKENFLLNNLSISINEEPPSFEIVLMNMISSEQTKALLEYPFLHDRPCHFIVSGLLREEEESYTKAHPRWKCIAKRSLEGWLAMEFSFAPRRDSRQ